jgi:hypothetical protein
MSVLMTARLRLMSSPVHIVAAFSAASSGASTFSLAALSSSAPIGQPSVALPVAASIWARLIRPSAQFPAISSRFLRIAAASSGSAARSMPPSSTVTRSAASARDSLPTTSFSMNLPPVPPAVPHAQRLDQAPVLPVPGRT